MTVDDAALLIEASAWRAQIRLLDAMASGNFPEESFRKLAGARLKEIKTRLGENYFPDDP